MDKDALQDDQSVRYAAERLRYYFPRSLRDTSHTAAVIAIGAYLEDRAAVERSASLSAGTP